MLPRNSKFHSYFGLSLSTVVGAVGLALVSMLSGSAAQAATLVLPSDIIHTFSITTTGSLGENNSIQEAGGNMFATLDGNLLTATYCVDIVHPIYEGSTYETTQVTSDGKVFGTSVNNADKVSWLLYQYGASATTADTQNALQAAIWKTINGDEFQVDGADNDKTGNSKGMIDTYKYIMSSLESNTLETGNVQWISPDSNTAHDLNYQGLVGLSSTGAHANIPEAGSLTLALPAVLALVGIVRRRRSA